jgi:hypothetical protein
MLKMYRNQIKKDATILIPVSPLSFSQKIPDRHDDANTNYYDGRLSPFLIPHIKLSEYLQMQIVPFLRTGHLWRGEYAMNAKEKAMNTFAEAWEKSESESKGTSNPVPSIKEENGTSTPPSMPIQNNTENIQTTKSALSPDASTGVPSFDVAVIQRDLNERPDPSDTRLIESARLVKNKWINTSDFNQKYFDANRKDLQEIIDYCLKHNWRPVLVTFPVSQVLLNDLGPNYLKKYLYTNLEKIDTTNISYINLIEDPRLTKNRLLFHNSDHLNYKGAAITSYVLLQHLIKQNYLPKAADGYDYSSL